jgi:flagellar protein FliS
MAPALSEEYLTTEVLTATPQKLHLMLVEGGLRSAFRAQALLNNHQNQDATESLLTAQRIMAKLIGGLNYLNQPALAGQIAAIYAYIYKLLVQAQLRRDLAKLADAIRLLQFERDTWRLACERSSGGVATSEKSESRSGGEEFRPESGHASADGAVPAPISRRSRASDFESLSSGFSCEA